MEKSPAVPDSAIPAESMIVARASADLTSIVVPFTFAGSIPAHQFAGSRTQEEPLAKCHSTSALTGAMEAGSVPAWPRQGQ
jgi:hypothetical protein